MLKRDTVDKFAKSIELFDRYVELKVMLKEIEAYKTFMCDPNNEGNCSSCPENRGMESDYQRQLPCGQQICWVTVHTRG